MTTLFPDITITANTPIETVETIILPMLSRMVAQAAHERRSAAGTKAPRFDFTTLVQLRKARGFSQAAFAEHLGMSRSYLCDVERGRATPSLETLVRLADALGCSLDSLVIRAVKP